MIIIASMEWPCSSIDIKCAFLQGRSIERDVFIKPPKEAGVPLKHMEVEEKCLWSIGCFEIMVCQCEGSTYLFRLQR